MPLRLVTAALVAAALSLCFVAGPASAHHEATVSITAGALTVDPPKCPTYERRPTSRCDGYRRASVSFSATCGATGSVSVEFLASRKGGGKPIYLDGGSGPIGQLSGSISGTVPPGAHVYAVATVECTWEDPDGTGPEAHTVSRSAESPEVIVPPWLTSVSVQKGNYCNFNPRGGNVLQARQRGSILSFSTDFLDKSLLGANRRTAAGVRQRRLGAKGAGINLRRKPEVFLIQEFGRREPFSGLLRPNPRKAGWLKVWEEVGGIRSNTLAIKVVRNRC